MKKLHKYEVIIEDGNKAYKIFTVAENKKGVENFCSGNGEIVRIKERPEILPSAAFVRNTLEKNGYGEAECDIIYRLLYMYLEGTENE